MPTAANEGKWRPTKNRYVFFLNVHFIFYFLITTKPTKAHSSQQRPTQVNTCPQQPTKANGGPRRSFFLYCTFYFLFFNYYDAHEGPQQPTTANAGQRRPTAPNKGQCRPTKTKRS